MVKIALEQLERGDETVTPRSEVDWMTVRKYRDHLLGGAIFPPILVGKVGKKIVIIDGLHRADAHKVAVAVGQKRFKHIECTITTKPRKEWYILALQENLKHGRPLSIQERRKAIEHLREDGMSDADIGSIIKMRPIEINAFVADRVVELKDGNRVVLKAPISAETAAEKTYSEVEEAQRLVNTRDVIGLVNQLIELFQGGFVDTTNENLHERLEVLEKLLGNSL